MEIIVAKDYQDMSEAAADIIAELVSEKPGCVLGLATGSGLSLVPPGFGIWATQQLYME